MKLKLAMLSATVLAASFALSAPASAAIDAPVPVANYITFGGLDWAWAGPCAPFASNSCNISGTDTLTAYQAGQGWRFPTASEFLARPTVGDFQAAGSPCASSWFGSGWGHCDYSNPPYDFGYGQTGTLSYYETWVVRGAGGVPEPATWALMIAGFGLAGSALRRRRTVAA